MKRREFIVSMGAAAIWPLAARAQQRPVIGFLYARSPEDSAPQLAAFHRGLGEQGFVEGQNITIEYRWARGQYDRMPALAAELVGLAPALLVAGSEPAVLAAKAATSSLPIVFVVGTDPVKLGIVKSYNRPGGNATGVHILTTTLEAKRLGLLHEMVPKADSIGVLLNPDFPYAQNELDELQASATALGLRIQALHARRPSEIDDAFEAVTRDHVAAIVVAADPFFDTRSDQLVALAARHAVPVMYQFRQYAMAGGLMSYGVDLPDTYRQAGVYVGRVLKGEKPDALPVLQPTKFEFVVNLKTAKALGLTFPPGVIAIADEVIE